MMITAVNGCYDRILVRTIIAITAQQRSTKNKDGIFVVGMVRHESTRIKQTLTGKAEKKTKEKKGMLENP